MKIVIQDFEDRINEVDEYIRFVWVICLIEKIPNLGKLKSEKLLSTNQVKAKYKLDRFLNRGAFIITPELQKTLKASCFLLLYNTLESTIVNAINFYFESFSNDKLNYKDVAEEIKRIWVKYHYSGFKNFNKKNNGEKEDEYVVRVINNIFLDVIQINPKDSNYYKNYLDKVGNKSEISGNLDARQIREVMALYGIGLPGNGNCDCLRTIKDKRNSLAHGEETFREVGKSFSIDEIMRYKDEMYTYLSAILKHIDKHIKRKKYKKIY